MLTFLIQRLAGAALVIFGVISIVFLLIHMIPGDPVEIMLGESASVADRESLRSVLGLDQPLSVQYLHYLQGVMQFDLGQSLHPSPDSVSRTAVPVITMTTSATSAIPVTWR